MPTNKSTSRTLFPTCFALLASLALAGCDPDDTTELLAADDQLADDQLADDAQPADNDAPDAIVDAAEQDPEEAGLLCILCILGGNHPVCGDDNVTYGNACWADCHDADVVHAGACSCGDGHTLGDEECDDGNNANTDACTNTCEDAACGDGFVQTGVEACDDDNTDNTDACTNTCEGATCGDGFVQTGVEACDDDNTDNTDACTNVCEEAACGDGFVQSGEECDDGNLDGGDSCSPVCEISCPAGELDQSNLGPSNGNTVIRHDRFAGQTFTSGQAGALTGIEVGLFKPCFQTLSPALDIQLSLYDDANTLLAVATLPTSVLSGSCGSGALDADSCGLTVFDLSSAGVVVTSGQHLRAELILLAPPPACDGSVCTGGNIGVACTNASQCTPIASIQASSNLYAGGAAYNSTQPGLVADLYFKTFVD